MVFKCSIFDGRHWNPYLNHTTVLFDIYYIVSTTESSIPAESNRYSAYVNHDCYDYDNDDNNYLELVSSYTDYANVQGDSRSKKPAYMRREKPQVAPRPAQ